MPKLLMQGRSPPTLGKPGCQLQPFHGPPMTGGDLVGMGALGSPFPHMSCPCALYLSKLCLQIYLPIFPYNLQSVQINICLPCLV